MVTNNRVYHYLSVLGLAFPLVAAVACVPEIPELDPGDAPPASPPVVVPYALGGPCDSHGFLAAVGAFSERLHDAPAPPGTEAYEAHMEGVRFRWDRMFVSVAHMHHTEMHDCQRMIVRSSGTGSLRYGPLIAIFTSDRVEQPAPEGQIVADIVNFSDEPYRGLGIEPGLNCLWMKLETEGWKAEIRAPGVDQHGVPSCVYGDGGVRAGAPTLRTQSHRVASLPIEEDTIYPTTARWMVHRDSLRQYIGTRCANAWCSITPEGLAPTTGDFEEVDQIPGWYDAQYLGMAVRIGNDTTVVLSGIFGTVTPGEGVQYDTPDEQKVGLGTKGQIVAHVRFEGGDRNARHAYHAKMGFPASRNDHAIRMRVTGNDEWQTARQKWLPNYHTIRSNPGLSHSGLRTVRWRWDEKDEGVWVPCDAGCCRAKTRDFQ